MGNEASKGGGGGGGGAMPPGGMQSPGPGSATPNTPSGTRPVLKGPPRDPLYHSESRPGVAALIRLAQKGLASATREVHARARSLSAADLAG
jgi:hypothetical protein